MWLCCFLFIYYFFIPCLQRVNEPCCVMEEGRNVGGGGEDFGCRGSHVAGCGGRLRTTCSRVGGRLEQRAPSRGGLDVAHPGKGFSRSCQGQRMSLKKSGCVCSCRRVLARAPAPLFPSLPPTSCPSLFPTRAASEGSHWRGRWSERYAGKRCMQTQPRARHPSAPDELHCACVCATGVQGHGRARCRHVIEVRRHLLSISPSVTFYWG